MHDAPPTTRFAKAQATSLDETATPASSGAKRTAGVASLYLKLWAGAALVAILYVGSLFATGVVRPASLAGMSTDATALTIDREARRGVERARVLNDELAAARAALLKEQRERADLAERLALLEARNGVRVLAGLNPPPADSAARPADKQRISSPATRPKRPATKTRAAKPASARPSLRRPSPPPRATAARQQAPQQPTDPLARVRVPLTTGSVVQPTRPDGVTNANLTRPPTDTQPRVSVTDLAGFGVATVTPPAPPGIEVASGPNREAVRLSWALLSERYGRIFGPLRPRVVQGAPGQRAYRLIAGPLRSQAQSIRVCAMLQARGVSCRPAGFTGQAL
ncbi:MAG: hypothetical protein AAFR04_13590 [Pseudomonadota bacterium]